MRKLHRAVLAGVVALAAAAVVAAPSQGRPAVSPGPWCGGTLWKLETLSDAGRSGVRLSPVSTSVSDIAKLPVPAKITPARTTTWQKNVWQLPKVVIERYRQASNGEIVLELYDVPTSTYMNAYLPNPQCLGTATRQRAAIVAARTAFTSKCPAPTTGWQMLGATAQLAGVGFWNPVRSTMGALPNGAELRPLTGLTITQGCGVF